MHFHFDPAALREQRADRARGELRRVAIAAEMTEHDALDFPGSNCSITVAAAVFERCPWRDWIRCFTGHGRCGSFCKSFSS